MLWFALGSLIAALISVFFGFGALPGYSWDGAKVLSVLFLAIALGMAVGSRFKRASWATQTYPATKD